MPPLGDMFACVSSGGGGGGEGGVVIWTALLFSSGRDKYIFLALSLSPIDIDISIIFYLCTTASAFVSDALRGLLPRETVFLRLKTKTCP